MEVSGARQGGGDLVDGGEERAAVDGLAGEEAEHLGPDLDLPCAVPVDRLRAERQSLEGPRLSGGRRSGAATWEREGVAQTGPVGLARKARRGGG